MKQAEFGRLIVTFINTAKNIQVLEQKSVAKVKLCSKLDGDSDLKVLPLLLVKVVLEGP